MKQSKNQPTETNHIFNLSSLDAWCQGPARWTNQPFSQHLSLLWGSTLPPLLGSCQAINQWTINQGSLLGSNTLPFGWILSINHQSNYQPINQSMKQSINQPTKQTISSNSCPLLPGVKVQPNQPTNQPFSQRSNLLYGSTPPNSSRLLPSNKSINKPSGFSYRVHSSHLQQAPAKQSINEPSIRVLL